MDTLTLLLDTFAPIAGRRLLDVGCGGGALAGALAARGARVTGIDPNPEAIARARVAVPAGHFAVASAGSLPFAGGAATQAAFDGAVILNALHHVLDPAGALAEMARVVRPGGPIVVVEPLAEGSFFTALRLVEDETEIRRSAQAAIAGLIASGRFACTRDLTYARRDAFTNLDGFVARVRAVDPGRAQALRDRRDAIAAVVAAVAEPDGQGADGQGADGHRGFVLVQPLRAHVLVANGAIQARSRFIAEASE